MVSAGTSSSPSDTAATLPDLFQVVQRYFLANPCHAAVFVPILRGEASEDYNLDNLRGISYTHYARELEHIGRIFSQNFPSPRVSSPDKTCGYCKYSMEDKSHIELHGRLVNALVATQDADTIVELRFILAVIIIHSLAHAFTDGNPVPMSKDDFPFYHSLYISPRKYIAEPGFFAEEGIFGGIIGIVFKEQENGLPPKFLEADFTRIAYLFLYDRTGTAYRLDTGELAGQLKYHRFGQFKKARRIEVPRDISERTCAAFNGDHLPIARVGAGRVPEWLEAILAHGNLENIDDRFRHECVPILE
ncbi:unnamed protein product [Somion occarium]|uniref:Uncharacterized protein n=1 Tax=Somion occarium TaxID=3059160 RepID=A0ABP1CQU1_9APHY